jgi:CRP-like cAMP-binding protein
VQVYPTGAKVVVEGQPGQHFYILQEGEAVVYQSSSSGPKKVNHLFKVGPGGRRWALGLRARAACGSPGPGAPL